MSYSPTTVSLGNLTEAAAAGVNLAIEDQSTSAIEGPGGGGTTTGYIAPSPFEP